MQRLKRIVLLLSGLTSAALCLPASAAEITGRVLDANGQPATHARVEVAPTRVGYAQGLRWVAGEGPPAAVAVVGTDEKGFYRLAVPEDRPYEIRVWAPGHHPMTRAPDAYLDDARLLPLTLVEDVGLDVQVTDTRGRPLPDARVWYGGDASRWPRHAPLGWLPLRFFEEVDEEGRVRLPFPSGGSLRVEAWAPGYGDAKVVADGSRPVRLRLEPGIPRLVEVQNSLGEPLEDVLVRVRETAWPAGRTGEDGRARVFLGPEATRIVLTGADDRGVAMDLPPPSPDRPEDTTVITLADADAIRGRAISADTGAPLPEAVVWYGWAAPATRTDAGGRFTLPISASAGPYEVVVRVAAAGHARGRARTPATTGLDVTLDSEIPVRGLVVTEEGDPVEGAELDWHPRPRFQRGSPFKPRLRTGPDGGFALGSHDARRALVIRAEADGFPRTHLVVEPTEAASGIELVLRRGTEILGRVVDEDGEPVPEARLALHELDPDRASGSYYRSPPKDPAAGVAGVTGEDGRFRLLHVGPGLYGLTAKAPGHPPAWLSRIPVERDDPVELPDIVLEPGATVRGRVVDAGGSPLEGVQVVLGEGDDSIHLLGGLLRPKSRNPPRSTQTDAEGAFRFEELAPGTTLSVAAHKGGYAPVADKAHPAVDEPSQPLELTLQRAARVHGRVVDSRGRPLAAQSVWVLLVNREEWPRTFPLLDLKTDEEGRFDRDDLPLGRLMLTLNTTAWSARSGPSESRTEIDLEPGSEVGPVLLVTPETIRLTGRLSDVDGQPVAGTAVRLESRWQDGPEHRVASTDASGIYRFEDLPVGAVRLTAEHPEHGRVDSEVEVRAGDNQADLRFRAQGRIDVRVTDEKTGEAITQGWVRWESRDDPGDSDSAGIDSDGHVVVRPRGTGAYRLEVHADGYRTVTPPDVWITEDTAERLELRLSTGVIVRGRVTGLDPVALGRVRVSAVLPDNGRSENTGVTPEGRFELTGLEPGTWDVVATTKGRRRDLRLVVPKGQNEMSLELDFAGSHTLTGVVRYNGEPVSEADLSVTSVDGETQAYDQTDNRGRFRLEGLPAGLYQLTFGLDLSLLEEREIDLAGDEELLLDLEGARVSGRVMGADGDPVTGALVALLAPDQPLVTMTMALLAESTGADGRFDLSRIATGSGRLHVRGPEGESLALPVEVAAPATDLGDLILDAGRRVALTFPAGGATPPEATVLIVDGAESVLIAEHQPILQGRLPLDSLPEPSRSLVVQAEGYAPAHVVLAPGVDIYSVELAPAMVLRLRVPALAVDDGGAARFELTDAAGRPPLYVRIFPQMRERLTVEDGHAEVPFLRPGSWTVTVTAADGRSWARTVTTNSGETTEVILE